MSDKLEKDSSEANREADVELKGSVVNEDDIGDDDIGDGVLLPGDDAAPAETTGDLEKNRPPSASKLSSSVVAAASSSPADGKLERWTRFIEVGRRPLLRFLDWVARSSASRPLRTVVIVLTLGFSLAGIGLATNFKVVTDSDSLWTPIGSKPEKHLEWINNDSGFPKPPRDFMMVVHADGADVLGLEGVTKVFDAVEAVTKTPGYEELCALSENGFCSMFSVTNFWFNRTHFEETSKTDEDVVKAMSALFFANGRPVDRSQIFGNVEPLLKDDDGSSKDNTSEGDILLTAASAYVITINIPPQKDEARSFEEKAIDNVLNLNSKWESEDTKFRVPVHAERSLDDEFTRAITKDIPLMVFAFIIMGCFCSIALAKRHRVKSQSLLGVGAVLTVIMSLMTGYGLLFCCGVPFTALTQIFPFILVGIGLDDTFILVGAYSRTDPSKLFVDRVSDMIYECGVSITVSTLTTFLAFLLGSITSIPAVRWFCFYAAPCIAIDFIYQITFFVALLAYDQRRIDANRYDVFFCWKATSLAQQTPEESDIEGMPTTQDAASEEIPTQTEDRLVIRAMSTYVDILLKPATKVFVLLLFAALLVLGCLSASQIEQQFDFLEITPADSYLRDFFAALESYGAQSSDKAPFYIDIYFRDIDASDTKVQDGMDAYIAGLVGLKHATYPPSFFWLWDFKRYVEQNPGIENAKFNEQITMFLETEPYKQLYTDHIVRDENGAIIASRSLILFDTIALDDVNAQVDALLDQREVTIDQPLNKNQDSWKMFTMGNVYNIWEFYSVMVIELLVTVILALVAVGIVSLLFIPHPMGSLLVTPTVAMIFVELLGVIQVAGLYLNSITAIGLVMSIGLVVDYSMHIVFTYFESEADTRNEKVREVLTTMGASVLIGGFSTFLGVLPLSFSQSQTFWTFFVVFMGIVFLGVGHGLIFIPVVLSMVGPVHSLGSPGESSSENVVEEMDKSEIEPVENEAHAMDE